MFSIGFDIGTSSLKVLALSENQEIVFENSYSYRYDEPQEGYRQIDPEIWYRTVLLGLHDAVSSLGKENEYMIGITGQMHTTVFLDQFGHVIYPAILWNDLRTTDMVSELKDELSNYSETKYIARIISPGSPCINTIWLKKNHPELFEKVAHVMTPYDYIVYRLTGKYSADYCDASTSSFYDIQTKSWSKIVMEKCGIDENVLGEVYPSCHIVGPLNKIIVKNLGVKKVPLIITGTGDNPANAVSLHLMEHKKPVISLGTSGVILFVKEDGDFEGKGKNVLFSADGKKIFNVVQGTVRSAGGAHKWWIEKGIQSMDFSIDQDRICLEKLGENKVLFFPHITGDKLIYADLDIRGAFLGLSANTSRQDMTQAVLEGVGFALKEVLENIGLDHWPNKVKINGGGTKSEIWMNILASILNVELEVVSSTASPCFGVCLLALNAHHPIEYQEDEGKKTYRPDNNLVKLYEKQYHLYKKIYKALKKIT